MDRVHNKYLCTIDIEYMLYKKLFSEIQLCGKRGGGGNWEKGGPDVECLWLRRRRRRHRSKIMLGTALAFCGKKTAVWTLRKIDGRVTDGRSTVILQFP